MLIVVYTQQADTTTYQEDFDGDEMNAFYTELDTFPIARAFIVVDTFKGFVNLIHDDKYGLYCLVTEVNVYYIAMTLGNLTTLVKRDANLINSKMSLTEVEDFHNSSNTVCT